MDNLWLKVGNIVAKGAISSFVTMFLKKPSAAESSESVYMMERVNTSEADNF